MKSMKYNIFKIGVAALGLLTSVSCTEISFGDNFLGDAPESSGSTLETMFSSKYYSEMVLTRAYQGLPYGLTYLNSNGTSVMRFGICPTEDITDICQSFRSFNQNDSAKNDYYSGLLSANSVSSIDFYLFGSADWATVKYAWIYLTNIDRVPDMTDAEKEAKKAEAKVVLAVSYFNMLRNVGGVPWLDHAVTVDEPMNFPRSTFADTVDNIVTLLDEAIAVDNFTWKWVGNEDGRMSKAAAMALKFKVLQFAASPTFNSDTKWHPEADEYTCYGNYSKARWEAAAAAGKAFFDEVARRGQYALIQPTAQTHAARRKAFQTAYYDRGGTEIIISLRKGTNASSTYGPDGSGQLYVNRLYNGPTLNYVDMFPWEDGTEFDGENFNWEKPARDPFFVLDGSADGQHTPTRDPRLYETVAIPGDIYFNNNAVPTFEPNPNYQPGSGFMQMKFILQTAQDRADSRPVQWPHTRLSEIMLGYAEVLNEVNNGPTAEAYQMVDDVRARVGLKGVNRNQSYSEFVETVLRERACELGFEEVRWFDLIRRDRKQDFTKKLYGLKIVGNAPDRATHYDYKKIELDTRAWATNWNSKWYLSPIPQNEINKKYGMTQNPGW